MINSKSLIDKVEEFYAKKAAERSFSAFLNEYKLSDVDDYDKVYTRATKKQRKKRTLKPPD